MENTLTRIKQYADQFGLTNKRIDSDMHLSSGAFARQLKENKTIGVDKLEYFLSKHTDINPEWLILGHGEMLREQPYSVGESKGAYSRPIRTAPGGRDNYISKEVFDDMLDNMSQLNRKIGALEHQLGQLTGKKGESSTR